MQAIIWQASVLVHVPVMPKIARRSEVRSSSSVPCVCFFFVSLAALLGLQHLPAVAFWQPPDARNHKGGAQVSGKFLALKPGSGTLFGKPP